MDEEPYYMCSTAVDSEEDLGYGEEEEDMYYGEDSLQEEEERMSCCLVLMRNLKQQALLMISHLKMVLRIRLLNCCSVIPSQQLLQVELSPIGSPCCIARSHRQVLLHSLLQQ